MTPRGTAGRTSLVRLPDLDFLLPLCRFSLHRAVMIHAFAAVVFTAASTPPPAARHSIPFDYAWRFKPVASPRTPAHPACPPFNTSVASGGTCAGLKQTAKGDASAAACRLACCASESCFVFQYGANSTGTRCWTGTCTSPFDGNSSLWASGAAPVPRPGVCTDCAVGVNDSAWELIDAPHDYIIATQAFDNTTSAGAGYFTRVDAVYRKHFALPMAWHGDRVALRFEGVFKAASVWVNGIEVAVYGGSWPDPAPGGNGGVSAAAYTAFDVRIDNISGIMWGTEKSNVVALYVNGEPGQEHWYTGAGLYRSVHLIHTQLAHLDPLSLFFPATIAFDDDTAAMATVATVATVHPTLDIVNDAVGEAAPLAVNISIFIFDVDDKMVSGMKNLAAALPAGGDADDSDSSEHCNQRAALVEQPGSVPVHRHHNGRRRAQRRGAGCVQHDARAPLYSVGLRQRLFRE